MLQHPGAVRNQYTTRLSKQQNPIWRALIEHEPLCLVIHKFLHKFKEGRGHFGCVKPGLGRADKDGEMLGVEQFEQSTIGFPVLGGGRDASQISTGANDGLLGLFCPDVRGAL